MTEMNKDLGVCPICGKPLRETERAYSCSGWSRDGGCNFKIWKDQHGHTVTEEELEKLLKGENLENLTLYRYDREAQKYKDDDTYVASLKMADDEVNQCTGRLTFLPKPVSE